MRKWARAWLAISMLPLLPLSGNTQGLNLTGSWNVQFTAVRAAEIAVLAPNSCAFQGTADVSQAGSQLSGDLAVNLTSGALTCPSSMSATLTGSVTGNQVTMGSMMGGGILGTASFTGTAAGGTAGKASGGGIAAPGGADTLGGTFAVTSGPFTGTTGPWSASRVPVIAAVPALGGKGLALLALLLLGTAILLLWRRRTLAGD